MPGDDVGPGPGDDAAERLEEGQLERDHEAANARRRASRATSLSSNGIE